MSLPTGERALLLLLLLFAYHAGQNPEGDACEFSADAWTGERLIVDEEEGNYEICEAVDNTTAQNPGW